MKVLAFDIGGTAVKYALMNGELDLIENGEFPSQAEEGGEHIISLVCQRAAQLKQADIIAISTAGTVDAQRGKIIYASENIPKYTGFEVAKTVKAFCGKETYVENDAVCAATGEAVFGAGREAEKFLCLTYGTGIGGSLVIDGSVYKGNVFNCNEIGHIITHCGGKDCTCGGNGCYEAYASCSALVAECSKILQKNVNARQIFADDIFSKTEIKTAVDTWIDEIVTGIVQLVQFLSVNYIVMGGGVMNEKYITDAVRKKVNAICSGKHGEIKIVTAELGNNAGLFGAAHIALKRYSEEEK